MFLETFLDQELCNIRTGKYGNLALLCNQCSYSFSHERYLFEILHNETKRLKTVFILEHGLFGENQDQIPLSATERYRDILPNTQLISLYTENQQELHPQAKQLQGIDTLLIDIQDVGSRYYTFATTMEYLLLAFATSNNTNTNNKEVLIVERPNPAGRLIEGTLLDAKYQSFVGSAGMMHRHGLTIGELATFYAKSIKWNSKLL